MKYQPKKRESTLNLAPMIDIVFLLLIFFLVSSTLQGEEALYNIILPDSSIGSETVKSEINLFLDADNQIFYKQKEYSKNNIEELISEISLSKESKVKIYADQQSNFASIVFLIENFKTHDFNNISFSLREKN